jgi:hypothetical protein
MSAGYLGEKAKFAVVEEVNCRISYPSSGDGTGVPPIKE